MREEKKSSYQAAIDAMREVLEAVVVIGLVLVAVFVPVAFFPGTTGRLYQQFSLTIAFAVVLSVFNAVTFTPALSALLLAKQSHTRGRFFTRVNRVIESGTNGYVRVLKRGLGAPVIMAVGTAVAIPVTAGVLTLVNACCSLLVDVALLRQKRKKLSDERACHYIAEHPGEYGNRYLTNRKTLHRQFLRAKEEHDKLSHLPVDTKRVPTDQQLGDFLETRRRILEKASAHESEIQNPRKKMRG